MASNLRKRLPAATILQVCDLRSELCQQLVTDFGQFGNIEVVASPKELVTSCQTVLSSLPSSAAVKDVYLNETTGVIAAPHDAGRLIIECSTIEIETTQSIGRRIIDASVGFFVDATVSGGAHGAKLGTLSFMVGHPTSSDTAGARILDVLSLVGVPDTIVFCGGLGMGQAAKIAHNYVCIANVLVATEGMALGIKYGVDKQALWKCMTDGAANSWVMHYEQPVPGLVDTSPSSHGYRRQFAASLGLKDLRIANDAARKVGLDPSAGQLAFDAFQKVHDDPRTRVSCEKHLFALIMGRTVANILFPWQFLDHTSIWLHVNGLLDEYFQGEAGPSKI